MLPAARPHGPSLPGRLVRRHPVAALFLLAVACNLAGSVFSILYNTILIVWHYLTPAQADAFWRTVTVYNLVAYPVCVGFVIGLLRPVARAQGQLAAGRDVPPGTLLRCQRRLVNLPMYQIGVNLAGWLPGAVVFPLGIGLGGGWENFWPIAGQFAVSFVVSALLTTAHTYFLLEAYLFTFLYPAFFQHDRPAALAGPHRITFRQRLAFYWTAVALVPLAALLVVVLNCSEDQSAWLRDLRRLALGVAAVGVVSSAVIGVVVGRTLLSWLADHARATEQIALGNFDFRIAQKRPGEFGQLTDRFNDMAAALAQARHVRETFGQLVRPDVRDEILERYPGLGGEVAEVTVLFVDLRGFTRQSAGQPPEHTVEVLNRFFSLAVAAVEGHGGWVNKFLGDGLMALFNVPRACRDPADRALAAAHDLVARLDRLNDELRPAGRPPLAAGLGLHTGPALVGCVGATWTDHDRTRTRKEFTAMGETVNVAQRLEQLTKTVPGPILLSEATRAALRRPAALECAGRHPLPGCPEPCLVYRALAGEPVEAMPEPRPVEAAP